MNAMRRTPTTAALFDAAMTSDEEGTRPPQCDGVSDEKLADMAEGIVAEMIAEVFEEQ